MKNRILYILIIALHSLGAGAQSDPLLRGRALMNIEKYDSALVILSVAVEKHPGNVDLHYYRGVCNFETKRYNEAINDFLFVNKRSSGRAHLMLAKTEARLGHPEHAMKHLREHLSSYYKSPEKKLLLDPDLILLENTTPWRNLWQEKDWYSPHDRELQEVEYLMSAGEKMEAINRLNELDETGFQKSVVNQYLAELYLAVGNEKASMDAINTSLSANSMNSDALKIRIELYRRQGAYQEASRDCERLLRMAPANFEYYLVAGEVISKAGKYEKASEQVRFYLQFYPDSHRAINKLGEIHLEHKKYLEALKSFNRALKMESGNATYYFNRGKSYAATGTFRYAEKDFSMALDLDPENPEIWYAKGHADIALENYQSACYDFRKAFQYGKYEAKEFVNRLCNN